ncbi:IPTL-CTERM sorting domain-containing protein [Paracidovorax valerianellae]|nr:IPTL-CTERM sorting domain-containing protein [Paracidovorax valerianellae]
MALDPAAINATGVPMDAPWALALLSALLDLVVWRKRRPGKA